MPLQSFVVPEGVEVGGLHCIGMHEGKVPVISPEDEQVYIVADPWYPFAHPTEQD